MNNTLEKQEYIQMFSASSTLNKNILASLKYAALYKNFEANIDPNASAHLWLYPASNRATPELNNYLQKALSKVSKLSTCQGVQLKKSDDGKPYFGPPYEKIAVSFSYTHQFGVLGLSTKTAIGVDLVEATELFKISDVVNSHFHFSEQSFFKTLDSTCAKNWFFNAWVLKEAALKSTGKGITSGGLSNIIVGLNNKSYVIKDGFKKEKAIAGSMTFKRNDTELVIGILVYGF